MPFPFPGLIAPSKKVRQHRKVRKEIRTIDIIPPIENYFIRVQCVLCNVDLCLFSFGTYRSVHHVDVRRAVAQKKSQLLL